MKKLLLTIFMITTLFAFAGPYHNSPRSNIHSHAPIYRPRIQHHLPQRHHHNSFWRRGGSNFWPGFIGGAISSVFIAPLPSPKPAVISVPAITAPVITVPVVVPHQQSVIVTHPVQVWVEGKYVDKIQPNGTILRVWQPGHYEYK